MAIAKPKKSEQGSKFRLTWFPACVHSGLASILTPETKGENMRHNESKTCDDCDNSTRYWSGCDSLTDVVTCDDCLADLLDASSDANVELTLDEWDAIPQTRRPTFGNGDY